MLLSREQIDQADDLTFKDVEVPEWGGTVRLKALTGTERDAYEASVVQMKGDRKVFKLDNVRARLVAMSLVDENGGRLYTDKEADQLGLKSGRVLDRLFDVARSLSGLTEDDIEELVEGFGNARSDEAGSD